VTFIRVPNAIARMRSARQFALALAATALFVALAPVDLAAAAEEGASGWMPTIAKFVNFAVLVGILVYFLRAPIAAHLKSRGESIRKDLVDSAALRASAERQLGDVRARLVALPAELQELTRRGQQELAEERVRMKDATARAREHLLERTRRDIDLRFRLARRELLEHTADLAVKLARQRIEHTMTSDDQSRLIDRYAAEVRP